MRIVLGGETARSVDPSTGLPVFDEHNTKITVTGEDGTKLAEGNGKTPVELTLKIGTKITVKAVVTTASGVWRGSSEYTVMEGTNTVAVTLSRAPESVGNILIDADTETEVTFKLASGKTLLSGVRINGNYITPVTARDSIGRIYILYDGSDHHFARFDAEGNPDSGFENAIMSLLPSSAGIQTMTVDAKTNTIFVVDRNRHVYAVTETEHNTFARSVSPFDLQTLSDVGHGRNVKAVAAYDNAFFIAVESNGENKVVYCKAALSGGNLSLTAEHSIPLKELRTGSGLTQCTGLFADANGAYCLLREQKLDSGSFYSVGALARYSIADNSTSYVGEHSKAGTSDSSLAFESTAFSDPLGFIGYDKDYIYIADDGIDISDDNYLGWCVTGNKNRVVSFDRNAKTLSFGDASSAPTWFAEHAGVQTKIPHLLWSHVSEGVVDLSMKTLGGSVKTLVSGIKTGEQDTLMTARDCTGRVYVLYKDSMTPPKLHLERFSADGIKDENFGTAVSGFTFPDLGITDIAVDFKTADVFLLKCEPNTLGTTITAYMAKASHGGYASFSTASTFTDDSLLSKKIDSAAAFDGTLFFAMNVQSGPYKIKKLYAYKMETSGSSFGFSSEKAEIELPELRSGHKLLTTCTGLFADKQGVYGLLTQHNARGADLYALGKIVRYSGGSTGLTEVSLLGNNSGLNPASTSSGSIGYDVQYLSNPVGFLGYDGGTLYIADDGINITYENENYRVNGNKDRIMAFNRNSNSLSPSSVSMERATWFASYNEYEKPNTKILLWEQGDISTHNGMKYWIGDNAETACPSNTSDALWAVPTSNQTESPIDVFCYDQDGNLYILSFNIMGAEWFVRRFALKEDGSYEMSGGDVILTTGYPVFAIAVDISDGRNILYYAYSDGPFGHIGKYSWNLGDSFGSASPVTGDVMQFDADKTSVTALAANKDGVFVATRNQQNPGDPYTLKVHKYKKDETTEDGHVVIVENAVSADSYTPNNPYNVYNETVYDLQIVDGMLYAITTKLEQKNVWEASFPGYGIDEFKSSGILYKIGKTEEGFSGDAVELDKKNAADSTTEDPNKGVGYGFYRFIAVKPKKLVIASDGAWGKDGNSQSPVKADNNKVFEYDLTGNLQKPEEKDAGGKFSTELTLGCGFTWKNP